MHHFFFQQLENYDVDFIVRLQNLDYHFLQVQFSDILG